MFSGAIILSTFNAYLVRTMLLKKSEDYALLLVENLNHQLFLQFVIPIAIKYGKIQLRKKEQFERMDKVVKSTLHGLPVHRVNIHDMNNIISYSFDQETIGRKNTGGTGYQAALAGRSTSSLIQRGNFLEILFGFTKESKLVTFAPLRAEKPLSVIAGPILGVVEVVQDLSEDQKEITRLQVLIIETSSVVMAVLFLFLRFLVKRGEGIIQKRTEEEMMLKEELNRARHLSALGEMTAGISHEIRNPLGIISSSAELLKKKMTQLDSSNTIPDIIIEESGRLNDIITDFLDYAKPQAPHLSPCRPNEILNKNIARLSSEVDPTAYQITTRYDDALPDIMADADMLYQAFLNLFLNAVQAMPDGGTIHVRTTVKNNIVYIIFEDQGKGVPDGAHDKIWDPFFTTKEKGTGLGLVIVKNIIESHEGKIWIENNPGSGARVIIALPVNQEG